MSKFATRLKALRVEFGLSQKRLAEILGVKQPSITQAEKGKSLEPRFVIDAARHFGVRPEWLRGDDDGPREAEAPTASVSSIAVIGHVQAGEWRAAYVWDRDQWYPIAIPPDRRYPRVERLALEVRGDSMNKLYPPGSILVAVRYADIGKRPAAGERVICLRHNVTDQVEATVKELELEKGVLSLVARTTNPRRYPPIRIDGGKTAPLTLQESGDEIEIFARVTGAYCIE
ncbi:hypothetical protein FRZ44_38330 [Hypericibacter terrae]|uniref:HTH cro/C1-type domain-containing protein n=1 Tax=Hypericibacter terrae TaxID=2602015 RepID=A0A5J6MUL4_9PROT|nr:LexA family transcriptional regulator [Hypericibacter terrae]QEX18526.1 hypothetical protein FRZ44_38330 [Hypericibacter terrae]